MIDRPEVEKRGGDRRSDIELVAAINAGDWGAFEVLYHRHREWTYRLAWRFTREVNDAQDVVQEVFAYLARKCAAVGGLKLTASVTTFLYPAVKHSALALRKKRRRMGGLSSEIAEGMGAVEEAGEDVMRRELMAALGGLSEAHREIVLMRFVDDLTLEEIGVALGIPLGTVKSRLHHAIAAMRESPGLRKYFEM